MSMGWGIMHGKSSKQKLNTKSSTEAEIVGVSEYIPYNIWLINFMREQGYKMKHNILYQDNESAIKMERNGRNSCTGNSRHVDIRYFFVKDRVDKKEIDIDYCPTYQMLADYYTKPLQGKMFHAYRDVLMGWKHISTLRNLTSSHMKERVENILQKSQNVKEENLSVVRQNNVQEVISEKVGDKCDMVKVVTPIRNYDLTSTNNRHKTVTWKEHDINTNNRHKTVTWKEHDKNMPINAAANNSPTHEQ